MDFFFKREEGNKKKIFSLLFVVFLFVPSSKRWSSIAAAAFADFSRDVFFTVQGD